MRSARPVRDHDFVDVVLGAAAPVVVGCADEWSAAPSPLGDLLDRLAAGHGWLVVARLDVGRSPRTAAAYRVAGGGTAVLLFEAGLLVGTLAGVPREDEVTGAFTRPVASTVDLP